MFVNEQISGVFAVAMLVVFVGFLIYIHIRRAQTLLQSWAEERGYEILDAEPRLFRKGPYVWSGRGQVVYRVWVRDREGVDRLGWVRCGSWWGGVLVDKVESQCDEV